MHCNSLARLAPEPGRFALMSTQERWRGVASSVINFLAVPIHLWISSTPQLARKISLLGSVISHANVAVYQPQLKVVFSLQPGVLYSSL